MARLSRKNVHLELSEEMKGLCKGAAEALTLHSRHGVASVTPDVFDLQTVPEITLAAYLARLTTYMALTKPQFLLSIEYVDRYITANASALTPVSVHRIIATAMVLAHKFDNDFPYDDFHYGKIMGVCNRDLMRLQFAFMQRIGYRLMYPTSLRELPMML